MQESFLWVIYGLLTSAFFTGLILTQEKQNLHPVILSFWIKSSCVVLTLPFIMTAAIPDDPAFYLLTLGPAFLFSIADVISNKMLPIVGAGVFSRVLPFATIISFLLWFVIDPHLITTYAQHPVLSSLIMLVLILICIFSSNLKKCPVSWGAIKSLWFVILANSISPIMTMSASKYLEGGNGVFVYTFFESLFMIILYTIYLIIKKPFAPRAFLERKNIIYGPMMGLMMVMLLASYVAAMNATDNPGYVLALKSLDAIFILAINRLRHKEDDSDVRSGMIIVVCTIILIILKSQMT